jgi:hypothetical protein
MNPLLESHQTFGAVLERLICVSLRANAPGAD